MSITHDHTPHPHSFAMHTMHRQRQWEGRNAAFRLFFVHTHTHTHTHANMQVLQLLPLLLLL